MKLKDIYERKIDRYINPSVVVGDMESDRVQQEIKEYVFSEELIKKMYTFLHALAYKKEGKTGIWISGYYGSGKSHFLKYLFYCLNKKYRKEAFDQIIEAMEGIEMDPLSDATMANIENLRSFFDKSEIEEIIFNVDSVSGGAKYNGTLTRILLNQLNKKRGYNDSNIAVALLIEKHLDKLGQFDAFKARIKEVLKEDWAGGIIARLIRGYRSNIVDIAIEFDPALDKESLIEEIKKDRDYAIEELVRELNDYVADRDKNYRLIFMMDEVSQYAGKNKDLLLNLQTVVEGVSKVDDKKVWIVCTAQEDTKSMDEKAGGFGKISGRFETKISLDSQDAAYITQKRVLDKNAEGLKAIGEFYQANKSAIENQFVFDHDLYQNYQDARSFDLAYPFIPYQFRLISDVIQSFNTVGYLQEGVKNTERSILGITHFTADNQKDQEVGYFISFDNFFNEQLNKNLTITANSLLNRAFQIQFEEKEKSFANRVIRVLFMISNLSEDKNVNFPGTVENIALLLLNSIHTVKQDLQDRVQKVLDKLVKENIIQSTEGRYEFLDDDEILVANSIGAEVVNTNTRLGNFYEDFIQKSLEPNPRINIGNKEIKAEIWIDEKRTTTGDDCTIKFVLFDNTDVNTQALSIPASQLNINLNQWFMNDKEFSDEFLKYCKTTQFLAKNRATATGRRLRTLNKFASNKEIILKNLQAKFKNTFKDITFTSGQIVYAADTVANSNPNTRYQAIVNKHVSELFKKHSWSNGYAQSNNELQNKIRKHLAQKTIPGNPTPAEQEIDNYIRQMGDELSLQDIVKKFEAAPYGWKDIATLEMVFSLTIQNKRRLTFQNDNLDPEDYFDKAINSRTREAIVVKPIKGYGPQVVEKFKRDISEIFVCGSLQGSEVKSIIKDLKENIIAGALKDANTLRKEYPGYPFSRHFDDYYHALSEITETRSDDATIELIGNQISSLKQKRDHFVATKSFVEQQIEGYNEIKDFVSGQQQNFRELNDETLQEQANDMVEYFRTDDLPDRNYPRIRKIYKSIKTAIKDKVSALKEKLGQQYEQIFDKLEAKSKELEIDDPTVLPSKSYHLEKIRKADSLSDLQIMELKAPDFEAETLILLTQFAEKKIASEKGETYRAEVVSLSSLYTSGQTLDSEEDIDNFISRIKELLLNDLKEKGKIILK